MLRVLNLVDWVKEPLLQELTTSELEIVNWNWRAPEGLREKHPNGFHVIIGYKPAPEFLKLLVSPKIVLSTGAGFDWADPEYYQSNNIRLVNQHGNAISVVEHAWALILDQTRLISYNDRKIRNDRGVVLPDAYSKPSFGLYKRKLGILGFGAIGKEIAIRGRAFGMEVFVYKRTPPSEKELSLVDRVYTTGQLEVLLPEVDVLVICLPKTKETTHMLNAENLSLLKKHTTIIITAPDIIEEEVLFNLLKKGQIRGAGLDSAYFSREQNTGRLLFGNLPFHELENVSISPHRGWHSDYTYHEVTRQFALSLDLVAQERYDELSVVDFDRGY